MTIIVGQSVAATTVNKIIALALKDIGALGDGESIPPSVMEDAFDTLRQLVGQWQIDGLMVYAMAEISFSLTGAVSYTIGDGADVNTTRPDEVASAFWRDNGIDYPLVVLTSFDEYQCIPDKSIASIPECVYLNPDYPFATLYTWPVGSSGAIHLTVKSPFPNYTSTSESLSVPAQYELAMRYSLAELLAPTFQLPLRPDIAGLAKRARTILKRGNVRIPQLSMPNAVVPHQRSDIFRG
jgi:hypothetical protein